MHRDVVAVRRRLAGDVEALVPSASAVTGQAAGGDRHVYANRTRFIPVACLGISDQLSWPPAEPAMPAATPDPGARQNAIDLAARMRAMWQ